MIVNGRCTYKWQTAVVTRADHRLVDVNEDSGVTERSSTAVA